MMSGEPTYIPRKGNEKGYVLLVFVMFSALLVVGLSAIIPKVAFEAKREKEEELIFRGQQYHRAIQLFFRKFGRYPNSLDELEETNGIRFLRKRYRDPVTGEDQWRLIHIGPGGVFSDARNPPQRLPNLGGPAASSQSPFPQGSTGPESSPGMFRPTEQSQAAGEQSPVQAALGGSLPGAGQLIGPAAMGESQPLEPALSPSANPSANPLLQPRAFAQSQQQLGVTGQTGLQPSPANQPAGSSQQSLGTPQVFGGGGIAGVASQSTEQSIKVWNGYSQYDEWEFIYNFQWDPIGAAALARVAGAQGQPPIQPTEPIQPQPSATATGTPSPQQPRWLGTPPADRPAPPRFPRSPIPGTSPTPRRR